MAEKTAVKQKTFWAGLALSVTGIIRCIGGDYLGGGQSIIEGLAVIFLRQAVNK